jgi:uncharacterized membrane protein YhhN
MNKKSIALALFVSATVIHLATIIIGNDAFVGMEMINFISKAFLMTSLAAYAQFSLKNFEKPYQRFIYSALIFSWMGDILLTWKEELYFLAGLSSFLIAHLFYIATYYNETGFKNFSILKAKPYLVIPYLIVVSVFLFNGYPKLQWMIIPVGVYSLVLSAMSSTALNRYKNVNNTSFWTTYVGSVLFMFSDFMIGWTVFVQDVSYSRFIIMVTYIAGQYLIVEGLINHAKQK